VQLALEEEASILLRLQERHPHRANIEHEKLCVEAMYQFNDIKVVDVTAEPPDCVM
jgi:hypothetical protein